MINAAESLNIMHIIYMNYEVKGYICPHSEGMPPKRSRFVHINWASSEFRVELEVSKLTNTLHSTFRLTLFCFFMHFFYFYDALILNIVTDQKAI